MAAKRKRSKPVAKKPKAPAERLTAPVTSGAFTMSQHVPCIPNWRDFMEGKIDLPQACQDGHPFPPSPQERGLIS